MKSNITSFGLKIATAMAVCLAAIGIAGCAAMKTSPSEKAQIAESIDSCVRNGNFRMDIRTMEPLRGASRNVNDFSVSVKGDTLNSALPFFGVVHSAPYGGGKGLNFTSHIDSYVVTEKKKGHYQVDVRTKTDEDQFVYTFNIFDSGYASLTVVSQNRDNISYTGVLVR